MSIVAASHAAMIYSGVSLAGAEFAADPFGYGALPGTYNSDYTYPNAQEVDYFLSKGMNTIRIPFRWERLQPTLNQAFETAELARLQQIVDYATSKGMSVILDPHNYARYSFNNNPKVIGSPELSNAVFTDLWVRLAQNFQGNSKVVFALMNEPHNMPTEQWVSAASAAIDGIRGTGAGNLILMPGNGYDGAHSWYANWYGTPNANAMGPILAKNDPNLAFEVHQYFDFDSSGTHADIVSDFEIRRRLGEFNSWLIANNQKGFLGEFGANGSTDGLRALDTALDFLEENSAYWLGWTYWAAGPWWGDYMFSIEPTNNFQTDKPQMSVLSAHAVPEPGSTAGIAAGGTLLALLLSRRRRG